jgi:hypothetical protein
LIVDEPERWQWPVPPFAWRHLPAPMNDVAQPCALESRAGAAVQGEMLGFDPTARTLHFKATAGGTAVAVPFARLAD